MEKIIARTAVDVCACFELSDAARALLAPSHSPQQFLERLVEACALQDAVKFLAYALPKREAVWWACVCARGALPPSARTEVRTALESAEAWVRVPNEQTRRPCMSAAQAADLGTPSGCAALAAFFSGGSLAPEGVPAVPPAEHLTAHIVSCAVMLSAVGTEPEKADEKYRGFLRAGADIARGSLTW